MANAWLRLWHDMPNDPKWRTIARVSGQPIATVMAVYIHLLVSGLTKKSVRSAVKSAVQLWSHLTGCSLWRKEKPDWQMM